MILPSSLTLLGGMWSSPARPHGNFDILPAVEKVANLPIPRWLSRVSNRAGRKIALARGRPSDYPPPAFRRIGVADTSTSRTALLSRRCRCGLVLTAVGLSALLGAARVLEPNPLGRGTHEQLGLPPCTFVILFNRPCPSCGMTTLWAWLMRGHVAAALRANAAGTLLCAMAMVGVPWLLFSAAGGRWLPGTPNAVAAAAIAATATLTAILQWGWRLLGG